jgi:hypothetical protein
LPEIIPQRNKDLIRMLRAARHIQRYSATDTKRGRPSHFQREELLKVSTSLSDILEHETSSHISVASFVDHYLRILQFPADVLAALGRGEINLFEAAQLARLTPLSLASTPAQATRRRAELLSTHLETKESGPRLRERVKELLRASADKTADSTGAHHLILSQMDVAAMIRDEAVNSPASVFHVYI